MNGSSTCSVLLSVLLTTFNSQAADPAVTADYRSPADMTIDERTTMMSLVSDYNTCVYQEGMTRVDKFADIRQAADAAMAACENTANKLRSTINGYGFDPGFSEQFVRHTQSRAARTLLPELAIRKSG